MRQKRKWKCEKNLRSSCLRWCSSTESLSSTTVDVGRCQVVVRVLWSMYNTRPWLSIRASQPSDTQTSYSHYSRQENKWLNHLPCRWWWNEHQPDGWVIIQMAMGECAVYSSPQADSKVKFAVLPTLWQAPGAKWLALRGPEWTVIRLSVVVDSTMNSCKNGLFSATWLMHNNWCHILGNAWNIWCQMAIWQYICDILIGQEISNLLHWQDTICRHIFTDNSVVACLVVLGLGEPPCTKLDSSAHMSNGKM